MINITKSQPSPDCLAIERLKKNGNYNCGDVLKRLFDDSHEKCYLCEDNTTTSPEIEHFKPHLGSKKLDRKFDWNNLLYVCSHCNGIKSSSDAELLNCTKPEQNIVERIKFSMKAFPKELAKISALHPGQVTKNTVNLLEKVYNYEARTTSFSQTKIGANNLRNKVLKEINSFRRLIEEFYNVEGIEDKSIIKRMIQKKLEPCSPFAAFKIWIVKENQFFLEDFKLEE